jgi:hypothetical protein
MERHIWEKKNKVPGLSFYIATIFFKEAHYKTETTAVTKFMS